MDDTAILFIHHTNSDVTVHNYNLLKKFNPTAKIFPIGFEWHTLMDGFYLVHRYDELPNNSVLNGMLGGGTSSETDLYIYDFFLHHQDFSSYILVEWDTYCNCSIDEHYGEAMKKYNTFSPYTFTNEYNGPGTEVIDVTGLDVGKSHERFVRRWSWYRSFFASLNEPTEQKKLLPYLGGMYPTSGLYYKNEVLRDMVGLILENPRLYDNIQNEMRLGTLVQQAGYKLNEFGGHDNQFFQQSHYFDQIKSGVKGYYHPVKTIL